MDEKDNDQNTPLHIACRYNRVDVVRFLLDKGADVTARNTRNMTCLDIAIEWEYEDVAKALARHPRLVKFFDCLALLLSRLIFYAKNTPLVGKGLNQTIASKTTGIVFSSFPLAFLLLCSYISRVPAAKMTSCK